MKAYNKSLPKKIKFMIKVKVLKTWKFNPEQWMWQCLCWQFGFISYEVEEGKKLFFHMTEVHDGVEVQAGDEVEFVVVQNQRNGKYSACSLRKIT